MKLPILSIILALSAVVSVAHADPFNGKSITCTPLQILDKTGESIGVVALDVISNGDGTYMVNSEDGGKNTNTNNDPKVLDLDNYKHHLIPGDGCSGYIVHIDLNTGIGTYESESEQSGGFAFGDHCVESGKKTLSGCKVVE